jgi:hypothetical protein
MQMIKNTHPTTLTATTGTTILKEENPPPEVD